MGPRTPNQEKALRWFIELNDLRPQLSTHPTYYFTNRVGVEEKHNIIHIMMNWEEQRKANKKSKA